MRQSIVQSLIAAAMLGVGQGSTVRPSQYAQDFEESETAAEYFNILAQQDRKCTATFSRLYTEQPDIAALDREGTLYTDETFLKEEAMAYIKDVNWKRASEVFPESEGYTLFKNNKASGISFHDIEQGVPGPSWVLSSIAAIAEYPERIYDMFDQKELNNAGVYSIRMYSLGVPVSVLVDDYIPETISAESNKTYVRVTPEKELWPVLMEKAFAKLHGTYRAIDFGLPTDSAFSLVGSQGHTQIHSIATKDQLWDWLVDHDAKQDIIQCDGTTSNYGLENGWSRVVLGVVRLSNGVRLVKVRNPWASETYTGPWNDSDSKWTKKFREEAGMVSANDGTFFIPIKDYAKGFEQTYANPDTRDWHHSYFLSLNNQRLGVKGSCSDNCRKNTFTIESETDQFVHIAANVHKIRAYVSSSCRNSASGAHKAELYDGDQIIDTRHFTYEDASFDRREMKAGQKFTFVVETDWSKENIQPDFSVTAWGEGSKVKITHNNGAPSDHYPLQSVSDEQSSLANWCDASVQVVFDKNEKNKVIRASHNCEGYTLRVTIGMNKSAYLKQVNRVTEEHQYSLDSCKIDSKSRVACKFDVASGNSHALGMFMKLNWRPILRYKHVWIKDKQ